MPYIVKLSGVRGDAFLRAIPLTYPGPPVRPLTAIEAQAIKDAYPVILMQVRDDTDTVLLSLSAAAGELSIEVSYPQPDGTNAPALLIRAAAVKCQQLVDGAYDIEFSGPSLGPYTWVGGSFALTHDVTRATV